MNEVKKKKFEPSELNKSDADFRSFVLHRAMLRHAVRADEKKYAVSEEYTELQQLRMNSEDEVERMLQNQMIASYNCSMTLLRKATSTEISAEAQQKWFATAERYLKLLPRQVEALSKYRNRGNQKITVQHVNVENGGQAVVGNIAQGRGGKA